jgi:cystathionine beta-lyase/cystathionine gamma-synthase
VREQGPSTRAVHAGSAVPGPAPRGAAPPIYQSALFELDAPAYEDIRATGGESTWWYTRLGNPTVAAAAEKLAALEEAPAVLLVSSGMAAISIALETLAPPGAAIAAAGDLYGDTLTALRELETTGRELRLVGVDDLDGWRRAVRGARVLYVEALSNPMLRVADLPALARLAHEAGAVAVVDATFASPLNVRPLGHGFDLVLHSATKYLNGHSDVVAGALAGTTELVAALRRRAGVAGCTLDPHAAFLLARGLRTLALRMERHNRNGLALARRLAEHAEVEAVSYPLVESHPDHALARSLLAGGSGLVTLRLRGGDERGRAFLDALGVVRQAGSLGGVESLACMPVDTSHLALGAEERERLGILPGTVRLSLGIEDTEDLAADIEQALAASAALAGGQAASRR